VRPRQSLCRAVSSAGIGLHSGKPARLTLRPAPPGCGIVFRRLLPGPPVEIPARVEHLVSTRAATVLGRQGARVGTVEHLLAALVGLGVDDLRIDVEGEELPALDGSAAGFVALLHRAGLRRQGHAVEPLRPRHALELQLGTARGRVLPAERLGIAYAIDFPHPALGRQRYELEPVTPAAFEREVATARTFGFLADAEALGAAGLARGASLENSVVFGDEAALGPAGLRWPDEPVRHKLLDLLGDLALLGRPLAARVEIERGGHALHAALVRALLEQAQLSPGARARAPDRMPWRDR